MFTDLPQHTRKTGSTCFVNPVKDRYRGVVKTVKMFEGEDIAFNGLEVCNYRHLQGMAKSMGLPSNVKKVHLIEMIRAKRYCTETDLKAIVDRVKMERKSNAQAKKKKQKKKPFGLQGAEVSSTSNSRSPPITLTPKRPSDFVIEYSPDITQTIMKYQPRPIILRSGTSILQPLKRHVESDRVLRSFNSVKRPNYRIMEQNDCMLDVANAQNSVHEIRQERVQQIRQERAYHSVNVAIQKHRPILNPIVVLNPDKQLVPVSRCSNVAKPAKRQRILSGIYPLQTLEKPTYESVPTVGFRRTDGRVTKINAVIQKPLSSTLLPNNHALLAKNRTIVAKSHALVAKNSALVPRQRTMTVQDMINYKVDHPSIDICKNALEGSSLYEIDYHSNEIDRQISSDYLPNDEIAIESRNYQVDNETLSSVQMVTKPTSSMSGTINIEMNPSRKVYKGCRNKVARKEGWNYSVEYQEHGNTDTRKEWNVYDINGQLLQKTDPKEQNTGTTNQCHIVQAPDPISTDYRVKQGRISEPISRDYQIEYQRFNQEMANKNTNHARSDIDQAVNQEITDRNTTRAGSDNDQVFNQEITDKNTTCARSDKDERFNQGPTDKTTCAKSDKDQGFEEDITDSNTARARSDEDQEITDSNTTRTRSDKDQEITDSNMTRSDNINASSQYPNMASLADAFPNEDYSQEPIERSENSNFSVYYHKKIRAEHVKSQKEQSERLPRINDAFSQFNDVQQRSMTPLYVQVSEESERVPTLPRPGSNLNNTCMLESLYNFKSQFVMNPPVLLIKTTQTYCTYSTKTISTAIAQPAAAPYRNNLNSYERANSCQQTEYMPRLYDYLKPEYRLTTDFGCDEVLSTSTTSLETANSQELGANVTIPEMVEDALELISQDGDYMERIGMDVRVQCILCGWAGPKIILQYHIKKEHATQVQHQTGTEWSVLLSLGELVARRAWCSQVLQRDDSLYVLSAKYVHTDVILVALSTIPTELEITQRGRITVYNKISGHPFTYEDDIKPIPDSMPYEYGRECLTLDIGKLDLIPNSRLGNMESLRSPEMNFVEVVVYVKLMDRYFFED